MKYEILEIITKKREETKRIGKFLAEEILKERSGRKGAVVVGLEGELGSGKTTFIQGMTRGLGIKEKITSPTFVILKRYQTQKNTKNIAHCSLFAVHWFYHIDCYRLTGPKDLMDLDFKEILNNSQNIITIEWAERVKKVLPKNTLWIRFKYLGQNRRKIIIGLSS